jgi:hypothetical protein
LFLQAFLQIIISTGGGGTDVIWLEVVRLAVLFKDNRSEKYGH